MRISVISFCSFLLSCLTIVAQDISGDWHGIAHFEALSLRITLHMKAETQGYSTTLDSPDQGASGIPVDTTIVSGNEIRIELGDQSYRGFYSGEAQTIVGWWTTPSETVPLDLGRQPIEPPKRSLTSIKTKYNKKEEYITMRDGVRLFTSIYTPKESDHALPILLWRTPYNSEPKEEEYTFRLLFMTHFLDAGYIVAFQDVRGRYMSEGTFMDVRPYLANKKGKEIDENSDTYDTIDWLVNNVPNNNGNVGILGISYPGFYSTISLPEAHPALKAVSPQAPVTDWFIGDDFHHNGAFFIMDALRFYASFGLPRPEPTRKRNPSFDFKNEDNYDFFLDLGPIKNATAQYFGDSIPFWNQLMKHGTYDDFWKARTPLPHLKNVKPSVMVVGGWFDAEDLYGPLKTYEAIETQNTSATENRLVMGPWYHGQWTFAAGEKLGNIHFGAKTSEFYKELELNFFEYYLKGKGEMNIAEATVFFTGSNEWREFDTWPPANTEKKILYLQADNKLSFESPTLDESYDEYISDPNKPVPYTEDVHIIRTREYLTDDQRFASRRPDVMVYETEILEEDISLAGPLEVDFFVSTTGTDADYVVKLIDVFPDQVEDYPENEKKVPMGGYQMLVRGEVLRGKFRNSYENPEPFVRGEVTQVSFEIQDVAHTFKKGHKIMVQVQNSWFPLVDRNPQQFLNIYECDDEDFIKATHRIYHDKQRPSTISVSVMKEK